MMNGFGRRGVVALVAATLTLAAFATTTSAGAAVRGSLGAARLTARMPSGAASTGTVPSDNEGAGYFMYPGQDDGIASVGATFTVPSIACQKREDEEWLLPGIWVFDGDGSLTEQVDVNVDCFNGTLVEADRICLSGALCDSSLAVNPGDVIEASLVYTAKNTVGTIRDRTQNLSAQAVTDPVTSDYTVFVGALGPSLIGPTRVPTFTSVRFSSVQVNGQYLSDWLPARNNLRTATVVQIKTSAISHNQNFTITFEHN